MKKFIQEKLLKNTDSGGIFPQAAAYNLRSSITWIMIAIIVGLIVGSFSSAFAYCLQKVTNFRTLHPQMMYLLPLGGIVIVFMYRFVGLSKDPGTNVLLTAIRENDKIVPPVLAPVIFLATLITHLFGGSAGREGAALQMGGSLGNTVGRILGLKESDRKIVVMAGMSAAFSAVFGTPLAASIFPMEMVSVGIMHYSALVPCVFASIVANMFATNRGIYPEAFFIRGIPRIGVMPVAKVALLGICCAVLSILFCEVLHFIGHMYSKYFKNPYVKVVAGGIIFIIIVKLLGTTDYCGAGNGLIERAIAEEVPPYAFLLKILLTSLTLSAGYKGGEIVPAFCTGATFGYVFGSLFNISPSMCAAIAMISVFCGVTNCPIASMLIGFELFGFAGVRYLLIAISISYMLSGYRGLYHEQIIMYSKFHTKYIHHVSGHEFDVMKDHKAEED